MEEFEEWYKTKKYPHIGLPITLRDYNWVKLYAENAEKIRRHSFLPFIHKTLIKRKFRADKENPEKNPSGKRKRVKSKPKIRDTFFSSHLDSLIFSKYNSILSTAYENYISNKSFNNSIVAYRKIPVIPDQIGNKCNIDFAKTTFEFIKHNSEKKLTVIIADITSFFDNLDHKVLKKQWCRVLDAKKLPDDHYNIYKALTRIKYVESNQLFESYNKTMIVERGLPNSSTKKEFIRKKITDTKYSKEKKAVAFCTKKEFLSNNLNLIISKNNIQGIPQGSPISATLANIYMLDFDQIISDSVSRINGFYQRYSDDLIIVCEQEYEDSIIKLVRDTVSSEVANLTIEPSKTKVYRFELINSNLKGFQINEISKIPNYKTPLEYLGFSYDGSKVLIKSSGFSKFYRSLKKSFRRSAGFAMSSKTPDGSLFKAKLYKRFTHNGANRKLIFRPSALDPSQYIPSKKYYWGNYLSYIYKADEIMKVINGGNLIRRQSRKFWANFNKLMKLYEKQLPKSKGLIGK